MTRHATIQRHTNETQITLTLSLDGTGQSTIQTGVGFLDHMLTLWAAHGRFDLSVTATGDTHVDDHHTTEDVGICLGMAVREALGTPTGIARYASGAFPMDEALVHVALDVSNRPYLHFGIPFPKTKIGTFDAELIEEWWRAFATHARLTLHLMSWHGHNLHHLAEASFKGVGVCLHRATRIDPHQGGIPSTKGVLS